MKISYRSVHLVEVSGATVAVNTTAYADNDLVGTLLTLPNATPVGHGGILQALTLHDLTAQNAALEVYVFKSNPSATTFTNNSALDIADADLPKIVAAFSVAATDYFSVAQVSNLAIPIPPGESGQNSGGGVLYACFRSAAATPTYDASALSAIFHFLQDPGGNMGLQNLSNLSLQ